MASIQLNKKTGRLALLFRYQGRLCIEESELNDNDGNREILNAQLIKLQNEILSENFSYYQTFPKTKHDFSNMKMNSKNNIDKLVLPLFEDFVVDWYTQSKSDWAAEELPKARDLIIEQMIPYFGHFKVNAISLHNLKDFRQKISRQEDDNGDPISPKLVNTIMFCMVSILSLAAKSYGFEINIKIGWLPVPKIDPTPLSSQEVSLFLKNVDPHFHDYYSIRFFTGMRSNEIDGLKWRNVDFDNNQIHLTDGLTNGNYHSLITYRKRSIIMSAPVSDALKRVKKTHCDTEFVFTSENGDHFVQYNLVKEVWNPCLQACGLDLRSPAQTRHTAATLWLSACEHPDWIIKQLGMADPSHFFPRYLPFLNIEKELDGTKANRSFLKIIGDQRYVDAY